MLTVNEDLVVVESKLLNGRILCPDCRRRLRPWGWARARAIRHGIGTEQRVVWHRPRRARCVGCLATHVLLDVALAFRRADCAQVIAAAVEANITAGQGHRKIAEMLDRPVTTVRGWLRVFTNCANTIAKTFESLVVRDGVDPASIWPAPARTAAGGAVAAIESYGQALEQRFETIGTVTWIQAGMIASAGRLFCASWWSNTSNTS